MNIPDGGLASAQETGHRDLLTVAEAAAELRLAPKSVRKLIKRKLLKVLPEVKPFLVTARSVAKAKEGCYYE